MFKKYIALIVAFIVIMSLFRLLSSKKGFIKSAVTVKPQKKSSWFYPMTKYGTRGYLKKFGQFIDEKFYVGRENLFPTQYFGYHSGVDLEVTPAESLDSVQVPAYAVTTGKILYVGEVQGYGGVVIQQIDGTHTALYGHIKLSSVKYKIDDTAISGQIICFLGNAYSEETAGERKHLHFAIHKGTNLYFLGHESTYEDLNLNWEDPTKFLKGKGAVEPK